MRISGSRPHSPAGKSQCTGEAAASETERWRTRSLALPTSLPTEHSHCSRAGRRSCNARRTTTTVYNIPAEFTPRRFAHGARKPIDTLYYCFLESPIGALLLCADKERLREIQLPQKGRPAEPPPHWKQKQTATLRQARTQLREYFSGRRRRFQLPLAPDGTAFQQAVWRAMLKVKYSRTISYGELAQAIERSGAGRAVGHACGANPLSIVVPCHRVIGSDGSLTGYAGGLKSKQYLLSMEQYFARYAKGAKPVH